MGEAKHLHEIGQRALATIVLPVGVGDEADRGIEGEVRSDGGHALRIEGQPSLNPHEGIEDEKSANMEEQHPCCVIKPALLAGFVHAPQAIEAGFDGP